MWGGGFTEAVRFLWEKHRFLGKPSSWPFVGYFISLQELLVVGRPGPAQHPGLPVALAAPTSPLWMAFPHMELQHWDLREPLHLQDERRVEPLKKEINKKNWKIKNSRLNQCRNAAKHGVSLLHGNCQAFTTIPSKDGKKPPNPRQPYIIIFIYIFFFNMIIIQSSTYKAAVSRRRCASSGFHLLGRAGFP